MEWPLLEAIEPTARGAVVRASVARRYERGVALWREGDPADGLHLIVTGHIAIDVSTPDGDLALLNVLTTGSTVGELSLLEATPARRSAGATALSAVETRELSARRFAELRASHPGVNQWLALLLAERVRALSRRVSDLMFVPLERRLALTLDELAGIYAPAETVGPVTIPLKQDYLAGYVGGTRPTINQALQRLVAAAVIDLGRGRVVVLDRTALREFADR